MQIGLLNREKGPASSSGGRRDMIMGGERRMFIVISQLVNNLVITKSFFFSKHFWCHGKSIQCPRGIALLSQDVMVTLPAEED